MSRHIRGHYRISDGGEVLPVSDVNASLQEQAVSTPPSLLDGGPLRLRIKRVCVLGVIGAVFGLGLMSAMPAMLQAFTEHQNLQTAEFRRALKHGEAVQLNGRHLRAIPGSGRDSSVNQRPMLEE